MGAWKEYAFEYLQQDFFDHGRESCLCLYLAEKCKPGGDPEKKARDWLDNHGYTTSRAKKDDEDNEFEEGGKDKKLKKNGKKKGAKNDGKRRTERGRKIGIDGKPVAAKSKGLDVDLLEECIVHGKGNAALRESLEWGEAQAASERELDLAKDAARLYMQLVLQQERPEWIAVPIEIDDQCGGILYLLGPNYLDGLDAITLNRMFGEVVTIPPNPFLAAIERKAQIGSAHFKIAKEGQEKAAKKGTVLSGPWDQVVRAWLLPEVQGVNQELLKAKSNEVIIKMAGAIREFRRGRREGLKLYYDNNFEYLEAELCPQRFRRYFQNPYGYGE